MDDRHAQADPSGRLYRYVESFWAMVKYGLDGLHPSTRAVWTALFAHADIDTLTCDPSLATIGRLSGLNHQNATRHLTTLEEAGLIERDRSAGGRKRTVYRLIVPAVALAQQQAHHQRNSSRRASATGPVAPAQQQQSRRRNTNHNQKPRPATRPIEPVDGGASRAGGGDTPWHVEPADLADAGKLIDLYCRWYGCIKPTAVNDDLLRFASAAVHARSAKPKGKGKTIRNRPALFAAMIRGTSRAKATQADEEEARRLLNEHMHGTPARRKKPYNPHE